MYRRVSRFLQHVETKNVVFTFTVRSILLFVRYIHWHYLLGRQRFRSMKHDVATDGVGRFCQAHIDGDIGWIHVFRTGRHRLLFVVMNTKRIVQS